jgi:hypothetical protein
MTQKHEQADAVGSEPSDHGEVRAARSHSQVSVAGRGAGDANDGTRHVASRSQHGGCHVAVRDSAVTPPGVGSCEPAR